MVTGYIYNYLPALPLQVEDDGSIAMATMRRRSLLQAYVYGELMTLIQMVAQTMHVPLHGLRC